MPVLVGAPPLTAIEPVTEILHGIPIVDPYRCLEDQASPDTRVWIASQREYFQRYISSIRLRKKIHQEVSELLSTGSIDSLHQIGNRYVFRKRECNEEQFSICMREGPDGDDQLLVSPEDSGARHLTAIQICAISPDGRLLAYQVREGGEETSRLEIVDVLTRKKLADGLPHGFLRGFGFSSDGSSFYYVLQRSNQKALHHGVFRHVMGTTPDKDIEIFSAGDGPDLHVTFRIDQSQMIIVAVHLGPHSTVDLYLCDLLTQASKVLLKAQEGIWAPVLCAGRIFAFTNSCSPNGRFVELLATENGDAQIRERIREREYCITNFGIVGGALAVSYLNKLATNVIIYDLEGTPLQEIRFPESQSIRLAVQVSPVSELLYESESFAQPRCFYRYVPETQQHHQWQDGRRDSAFDDDIAFLRTSYRSDEETEIPIFLAGKRGVLSANKISPVIMTSYGGFGVPSTPQFSVLATLMMRQGCIFALPSIRGGSEFGSIWHDAAKRRNRQKSFDDFIAAAEWLVQQGITSPDKLAIFGGSNSGLLVAAVVTQRPELFGACLCIAPLLDMLRYHLFDDSRNWQDEFGSADDYDDFKVLQSYSPYHNVRDGARYPATLVVSGDADRRCNAMHARKMTARLQAANASGRPILLDYSPERGHVPVLPLSMRIEALTNRLAFLQRELDLIA
jgi:prolyl oligopeptidase